MHFFSVLVCVSFALLASADWSTEIWDAIVVGAGPAGIIVASRLAEAGVKTLLLEAGGPSYGVTGGDLDSRRPSWLSDTNLTRVDVPGLYKSIFATSSNLTCTGMVNAFGGCTVGGSSAINAGLFFEPPASDYDLYFPRGWKSAHMKNATRRLYSMQPSTNITSQDGIRYLQSGYDAARQWLVEGLGYKEVDINAHADDKKEVFGHPIFDYANGQRGGPVTTYLQSALAKPNFHLQTGAKVKRVEREAHMGEWRATGVTVVVDNVEKVVNVSKGYSIQKGRVVLSAGALQSPALLMFSGIGPNETLSVLHAAGKLAPNMQPDHWINNSHVGGGLFDNPNTFIELRGDASVQSYTYSYENPPTKDKDLYLQSRSGPYSFASETSVFWDILPHPDGRVVGFQGTIDSSGYGDEFQGDHDITLNIYGTSGLKSRGRVVLDSNFVPGPDGNVYYSDPQDAKDIASFIYKIFQGLPASGLTPLNLPQNSTQAEIERYITTGSAYARGQTNHWSSSCKMVDSQDRNSTTWSGCVAADTQAMGVSNIHVVDGSIVPPLTVNPQFGIMVVAEEGADWVASKFGKSLN
ncbi:probable cellobiose dehydrogenase [Phialocephala subalpina]|uniref:Probable cellobiose dehydrogenase n=1 Tax=Phialocephala subalpina TaxID=576137 RepID=A0A1L7XZ13_9HELO|nr:probable cellobiose dehydrogenase [Phialocephala subalpina]